MKAGSSSVLQSRPMRNLWFIAVVAFYHACGTHNVSVTFYAAEGHEFSREERQAIQTVADQTLRVPQERVKYHSVITSDSNGRRPDTAGGSTCAAGTAAGNRAQGVPEQEGHS